mgnify:CR=1 FL=1
MALDMKLGSEFEVQLDPKLGLASYADSRRAHLCTHATLLKQISFSDCSCDIKKSTRSLGAFGGICSRCGGGWGVEEAADGEEGEGDGEGKEPLAPDP